MNHVMAMQIKRAMRRERITIRQLAARMGVTMKRVREVRDTGAPPPWANASEHCWKWDWFRAIDQIKESRNAGQVAAQLEELAV